MTPTLSPSNLAATPATPATLAERLAAALADPSGAALEPLADAPPADRRDRALTLLAVYDLHTAPLEDVGETARHQGHPAIAAVKRRLETAWLAELDGAWADAGPTLDADQDDTARSDTARSDKARSGTDSGDAVDAVVGAMRAVAARDRLPAAYRWLAREASWEEVVAFLALEGGPDGGFDDLIAMCQVGLSGSAKLELGKNYWDEMGCGDPAGVHTVLHRQMSSALGLPDLPREQQGVEALERVALGGLLATNRWLQPEMIGALGLLELQAGPRCRLVLQAFDRLGAPADAYPFYVEHAEVDPVHGRDWMDKAVVPTVAERPAWGPRIVKGAWWRSTLNLSFFEALRRELSGEQVAA